MGQSIGQSLKTFEIVCLADENILCNCVSWNNNIAMMCEIMTEELVIREIRLDEAAGQGDSDSLMTISMSLCHLNSSQL